MRKVVLDLINMGPLPSEDNDDISLFEKYQEAIEAITPPVTKEEAASLVLLFGNDGCYGLSSALVHLIESAVDFNIRDYDELENNVGVATLRVRAANARDIREYNEELKNK